MNSNSLNSAIVLKRIQRDYLELKNNPVKGIGIIQVNQNNPFNYIINLKILTGCYDGLILQLKLTIPSNYPIAPPKATIFPGQGFSHSYHHHVFPTSYSGDYNSKELDFCIDLLENRFGMNTKAIGSGWTSAYTFKAICLQLQNFLADPDMGIPSSQQIQLLFNNNKKYEREFMIGDKKHIHSYNCPFPEIYGFEEKTDPKQVLKLQLQEKLTCYFTKTNPLIDTNLIVGYPVDIRLDFKRRIEPFPIPEIVSHTGYTAEGIKGRNILDLQLKTAYGQKYNFWIPIYINNQHYELAKDIIKKSIAILKIMDTNKTEKHFEREFVTQVFPALLCKMIVFLLNGTRHNSIAAIEAFCHYILLFQKMIDEYKLKGYIDSMVEKVIEGRETELHKHSLPDIGNFIVLLFFSKYRNLDNKELILKVFREYLSRQIYWIFIANQKYKDPDTESNCDILLRYFIDDPNIFKEYEFFITKYSRNERNQLSYLEKEILKHKIFFETLFYKYSKNIGKKFQYFCFLKEIFKVNVQFDSPEDHSVFIEVKELYNKYTYLKRTIFYSEKDEFQKKVRQYKAYPVDLLDQCTEISKKNIMRQIFKFANVSNQLLIFTFLASKTFITPEFIEKLENNYGVIDTDDAENFILKVEELKRKVDTYDKMFELLGVKEMINEDICENFFRSCCQSNRQNYTSLEIPRKILLKFK